MLTSRIFQEAASTPNEIKRINDVLDKLATVSGTRPLKEHKTHFLPKKSAH